MRRQLAIIFIASLSLAACSKHTSLPGGIYSGSDHLDRAVTLTVSGAGVKVGRFKTRFQANGDFVLERTAARGGPVTFRCAPREKDEELRCRISVAGAAETVDLMRE